MSAVDSLTGLFPTIVVAGTATKMTQSMFRNPITVSKKRSKARAGYPSTKYRPW